MRKEMTAPVVASLVLEPLDPCRRRRAILATAQRFKQVYAITNGLKYPATLIKRSADVERRVLWQLAVMQHSVGDSTLHPSLHDFSRVDRARCRSVKAAFIFLIVDSLCHARSMARAAQFVCIDQSALARRKQQ